jgi:hypothetical protein
MPPSRNRAKLNKRILETAAEFVTATNASCRQAVSPAMHEFILNLVQISTCIQVNDDAALIDAAPLLDTITEKRMTKAIRERGDAKFTEAMVYLSEVRFANLVVDAKTVHSLKTIACLLSNPHYPSQTVVFALRENTNFTIDAYATLFAELSSCLEEYPIVICSVISDHLFAQSHVFDRVLDQSVILHVKCFTQMINLVFVNAMTNAYFAEILDEMRQAQWIFRLQPAADAIGCQCPKFVRTRWFFMMDYGKALGYRDHLPLEIFELYIIMLPFSCFLGARESRARALLAIVSLSRQLLTVARNISS